LDIDDMRRSREPSHTSLRIRGFLLRRVGALERRTLALGLAVAAVGGVIMIFAWLSTNGLPFQGRYPFSVILPGSTPPVAAGAQVRIAGKIAGSVTSVQPAPDTLRVNASLDPTYAPLGRGARVHVGVLLGTTLVYLVINPGDYHHPLPPGSVIPQGRVTLSSSLPQALEAFDAATRAALARNITVTGEGWIGRGAQTNTALAEQRIDYEQGTPILRALIPVRGVLARVVNDWAAFTQGVRGQRPDDNAAGTTGAATFWQTLAAHDRAATATQRFSGAEHQLLLTLPLANRTIAAGTAAAQSFEPLARQVASEDPDFAALFNSAPSLVDATRRFNRYAPHLLAGIIPILDALRDPARSLPLIVRYGAEFDRAIHAYGTELRVFARQLAAVTGYRYGGKAAIRITGTLGCIGGRDPYPAPGQAARDRRPCR
jgi:hypothetical protein